MAVPRTYPLAGFEVVGSRDLQRPLTSGSTATPPVPRRRTPRAGRRPLVSAICQTFFIGATDDAQPAWVCGAERPVVQGWGRRREVVRRSRYPHRARSCGAPRGRQSTAPPTPAWSSTRETHPTPTCAATARPSRVSDSLPESTTNRGSDTSGAYHGATDTGGPGGALTPRGPAETSRRSRHGRAYVPPSLR
jgi:hypothetical protein